MADEDVERVWQEFWWPTISEAVQGRGEPAHLIADAPLELGEVTISRGVLDQIKRELFDFKSAIDVVPAVYDHATGGQLSRIEYNVVAQITGAIDEHYDGIAKDQLVDALLDLDEDLPTVRYDGPEFTGDVPRTAVIALWELFSQSLMGAFDVTMDDVTEAGKTRERVRHMIEKAKLPEEPGQ